MSMINSRQLMFAALAVSADPFQVDNAAVAVTPIGDETSAPISVDAT